MKTGIPTNGKSIAASMKGCGRYDDVWPRTCDGDLTSSKGILQRKDVRGLRRVFLLLLRSTREETGPID